MTNRAQTGTPPKVGPQPPRYRERETTVRSVLEQLRTSWRAQGHTYAPNQDSTELHNRRRLVVVPERRARAST